MQETEFLSKDNLKRPDNMKVINNKIKTVINDSFQKIAS